MPAISAAASVFGASMQADAAEDAASMQAEAAANSIAEQRRQFDLARQDLAPFRVAGTNALADLMRGFGYDVTLGNAFTGLPFTSAPDGAGTATDGFMRPGASPEELARIRPANAAALETRGAAAGAGQQELLPQQFTRDQLIQAAHPYLNSNEQGRIQYLSNQELFDLALSYGRLPQPTFAREAVYDAGPLPPGAQETPDPDTTFALSRSDQPGEFNTPLVFDPGEEFRTPLVFEFDPSRLAEDEGYQFRLNEGLKAQRANNAASGLLLSGDAAREAQRYGEGLASNELNNAFQRQLTTFGTKADDRANRLNVLRDIYNSQVADRSGRFNRLAAMAGIGQTATNSGVQAGQNTANSVQAALMGGAANRGIANMAAGTAWASGAAGVANAFNRDRENKSFEGYLKGFQNDVNAVKNFFSGGGSTGNPDSWRSGGGSSGIGTL